MQPIALGHIVCETIFFPDRTLGPVLGSPPAYSLVAAAKQGTKTGIVTKIGPDFPLNLLAIFERAGVDMQGIDRRDKSTISNLIYDAAGNKEIRFPSRANPVRPDDVPTAYRGCQMVYVCTMEDDVPLGDLASVVKMGKMSAIDIGGYGGVHMSKQRRLQVGDVAAFGQEAASHFDFVKASDEDCRAIFGAGTPEAYGKRLVAGRTRASLITLGSKGVLLTTKEGGKHIRALPGKPIDATGGGDTFMGGFLSEYLRCGDVFASTVFGSATALCVIEKTGGVVPERMPTESQARSRIPLNIMELVN